MAKKELTGTAEVTKDLQEIVRKQKNIENVYFDENGNHYFHKHSIDIYDVNEKGFSTGKRTVEALPGSIFGVAKIELPNKKIIDKRVNVEYKPISSTMSRDEILSASISSSSRTEKEKLEILSAAAEIAKGGDFESLIKKITGK